MKPLLKLITPDKSATQDDGVTKTLGDDLGFRWQETNWRGQVKPSSDIKACALHQASEVFAVSVLGFQLAAARTAAGLNTPTANGYPLCKSASMMTAVCAMRKSAVFAHRIAVAEYLIRSGEQPFISADELYRFLQTRKDEQ